MTSVEQGVADKSEQPKPVTTRQAVTTVAVLAVIAAIVVLIFAFGTANTPHSVDGRTATTSKHID